MEIRTCRGDASGAVRVDISLPLQGDIPAVPRDLSPALLAAQSEGEKKPL